MQCSIKPVSKFGFQLIIIYRGFSSYVNFITANFITAIFQKVVLMDSSSEGIKERARKSTRTPLHSAAQHKACLKVRISADNHVHRLQMPGEDIAFIALPKIKSQSQIFSYGRSTFCLPHQPKFSDFFDFCLHCVSVVRGVNLFDCLWPLFMSDPLC